MEKQSIAVLIMVGVYLAFNTFIWFLTNDKKPKIGPIDSVSDSVKVLKGPWVGLFSLFALGLAAPLSMFLEISGWFIIPMACLVLLAATPLIPMNVDIKGYVTKHILGAAGSIASAMIIIQFIWPYQWWIWIAGAAAFVFLNRPKIKFGWAMADPPDDTIDYVLLYVLPVKNYTLWIETAFFGIICIALFIR